MWSLETLCGKIAVFLFNLSSNDYDVQNPQKHNNDFITNSSSELSVLRCF